MSFNISLSGINAAQKDLNTTSNNIANVNTTGFKESRAEFADVYANSLFSNSSTNVGSGVATAQIAQQFHQGALSFTNNALDLAINGNGFFVTSPELGVQDYSFTRAGAFKLNDDNFIVDSQGNYLMSLPVNDDGSVQSVSLSTSTAVQIPQTAGQPSMSNQVDMGMNLPADASGLDPALFDPNIPSTYNASTSVTIYDSLGEPHVQTMYFVKPSGGALNNNNQWIAFTTVDGNPVDVWDQTAGAAVSGTWGEDTTGDGVANNTLNAVGASGQTGFVLRFDDSGGYIGSVPTTVETQALGFDDPSSAAAADGAGVLTPGSDGSQRIRFNFNNPTQYAAAFEITELDQDGATVGRLTNVEVNSDGLINATYTNGTKRALGKVALANFSNEQGLTQTGNTAWRQSQSSGEAVVGEPNVGTYGAIRSAALEQSNVDLTTELVDLISAQRNFQANSRALDVSNQISQSILQIR